MRNMFKISLENDFQIMKDEKPPIETPCRFLGFDGASFSSAVFNLYTTIVGAGIMALPATLKQLGMIPGLIVIVLGAMLTEVSINVKLRFNKASKVFSYMGLVGDEFGGALTPVSSSTISNTLLIYMIIIGTIH
ncbi:hypothetical protein TEA_028251 [Camellia sinensis var. sinensis]|uniref:Amino acid transporter transmembrane domain-containing protein n=1 Tax=Camellia sinensis var. sinensis TaxID=542762 RepID=A0A4V3WL14_CAMSN|nr:hypothetical protein TEA_028251 [Camellia sinensis var. sinensis]